MAKSLVIINVLNQEIFNDCRIKGSICVPLDKLAEYAQKNLDLDDEIVLYCSSFSCTASDEAWTVLNGKGFKNLFVYAGGAAEWFQKQYPMEGACQNAYLGRQEEPQKKSIPTISAQELQKKMVESGIL